MISFLERQFKISERGSSVKTEILSGVVTFVTMSYIIFVNPDTLAWTSTHWWWRPVPPRLWPRS